MLADIKEQMEEQQSPVRLQSEASGLRLRKCHSRIVRAEVTQRPTPGLSHCPPRHPCTNAIGGQTHNVGNAGDGPIMNLRRPRLTSLLREDDSDNEADSPRFRTRVQHDQTWRKIEKFPNIRNHDKADLGGEATVS